MASLDEIKETFVLHYDENSLGRPKQVTDHLLLDKRTKLETGNVGLDHKQHQQLLRVCPYSGIHVKHQL